MPKVMVVDDDKAIIELLETMLSSEGFCSTSVSRSVDALDHIRREMPDVILLDLMMPKVDGWQVLAALKKDAELRHIPVVVVTARVDAMADSSNELLSDLAGFLLKPFDIEELMLAIQKALGLSNGRELGSPSPVH
jgi:two-component system response regulator VicR